MAGKLSKVKLNDYKPLREVIFDTLREAIIIGELKPGQRLMEVHLAEKMGVSRTPVREAIRKLELEGLVNMIPRKGAHVADLSIKEIMDVLEVRASLDSLATGLAAVRINDDELKSLKNAHEQFLKYAEKNNLQGAIKKDVEFHDIIYAASKNEKLLQILGNLREQVHRYRVIYLKEQHNYKEIIKEHNEIIEALSAKDEKLASVTAARHIKTQQDAIINALKANNVN